MDTPLPQRVAVVGWAPEAAAALAALEETGAFRGAAVLDPSTAALVDARSVTGLPCSRSGLAFLQRGDYDAVLLAAPVADAAVVAAARGARLLLLADTLDVPTTETAVHAATAHDVPLTVLRPASHDAGLQELQRLVESDADWAPHFLEVTVEAATDTERLLGAAVAHATRLGAHLHGDVRASPWGEPLRGVTATIDDAERQVRLHVRHAPDAFVRITGDAPAGAFELRLSEDEAMVCQHTYAGERLRYRPAAPDPWTVEAYRAADPASCDDREHARREVGLRSAIERAALTGEAQSLGCCARPELRLLHGGGHRAERRTAGLHLVVS